MCLDKSNQMRIGRRCSKILMLIWSKRWQLPFNESKCKAMHYGKTIRKAEYNLGGIKIMEVTEEKDLGVTFDQQLSFGTNASKVVAAENSR